MCIRRQRGVWCDTTSARGVCRILRPMAEAQAVFRTQEELRGYTERYRLLHSMLPDVGFTPTVRSVLFVVCCCFHRILCLYWLIGYNQWNYVHIGVPVVWSIHTKQTEAGGGLDNALQIAARGWGGVGLDS